MPRIFAAALLAGTLAGAALAGGAVLAAGGFASRPGTDVRATRATVAPAAVAGRPVRVPAGYRLRSIPETGARVAIPHGWFALGRSDAVFPGVIQTLTRVDHSLLPSLVGLTMAGSPLKLFAFERHASDGSPATTMQVLVDEHGAPRALSRWSDSLRAAAARSSGLLGRPSVRPFALQAGRAVRVDYARSVPCGRRIGTAVDDAGRGGRGQADVRAGLHGSGGAARSLRAGVHARRALAHDPPVVARRSGHCSRVTQRLLRKSRAKADATAASVVCGATGDATAELDRCRANGRSARVPPLGPVDEATCDPAHRHRSVASPAPLVGPHSGICEWEPEPRVAERVVKRIVE